MTWYSVRVVLEWGMAGTYEERVTLWRAASFDEAIELAEREAVEYSESVAGRYLGIAQAYHIGSEEPSHGDEVFSLLRTSELGPSEYVTAFFDTGDERTQ